MILEHVFSVLITVCHGGRRNRTYSVHLFLEPQESYPDVEKKYGRVGDQGERPPWWDCKSWSRVGVMMFCSVTPAGFTWPGNFPDKCGQ